MSQHSPFRVGGPCAQWAVVHDRSSMISLVEDLSRRKVRFGVLGAGTKTLFRDGGVAHVIIRLGHGFQQVELESETWTLGAAVPLVLARYHLSKAGVAFLPEYPVASGTLGGLLATASVEQWKELAATISAVEVVSGKGYRWRSFETMKTCPKLVTSVRLKPKEHLQPVDDWVLRPQYESLWFKGPGSLKQKRSMLQRAALSGARLHGVLMPPEMPDQLVNIGGASARDFWELHRSVLDRIRRFHGVTWTSGVKWQGRK